MGRAEIATKDKVIVRYQKAICVRGYHVYKAVWEATTGKTLVLVAESGNSHNRNIVAVEKDGKVIGYLSWKVLRLCSFLKKGGSIHCTVTTVVQEIFTCKIFRLLIVRVV